MSRQQLLHSTDARFKRNGMLKYYIMTQISYFRKYLLIDKLLMKTFFFITKHKNKNTYTSFLVQHDQR